MQRTKGFNKVICIVFEVCIKTVGNVCPNGCNSGPLTEIVREVRSLSLKGKNFLLKKNAIVTKESFCSWIDKIFDGESDIIDRSRQIGHNGKDK